MKNCLLVVLSTLPTTGGFVIGKWSHTSQHESLVPLHLRSIFDDDSSDSAIQFWLDLRSTALGPKEAIEYLCRELDVEVELPSMDQSLVQRVVVLDRLFQQSTNDGINADRVLLVSADNTLKSVPTSEDSGSILCLPSKESLDIESLMMAANILSSGKWIVLDDDDPDPKNDAARNIAVESCLGLLSSMSESSERVDETSGLVLKSAEESDGSAREGGGIAVQCATKSLLIQLVSNLQSRQTASKFSTTASGIVIQESGSSGGMGQLPIAVLLPFDISLWKTVLVYT